MRHRNRDIEDTRYCPARPGMAHSGLYGESRRRASAKGHVHDTVGNKIVTGRRGQQSGTAARILGSTRDAAPEVAAERAAPPFRVLDGP